MDDLNGDFLLADEKIEQGLDWQETMTIPVAGEQMEFGFTLLNERVRQKVQNTLPMEEFQKYQNEEVSEEHKRLMELQRKDDLTEDQEEELLELAEEVNPEEEGREKLGEDAVDKLMDAGKHAIEPTEGDVQDVLALPPDQQEDILGHVPQGGADEVRDDLRAYMRERIEEQPFPIKFMLGQRAYMETVAVAGNGFQNT